MTSKKNALWDAIERIYMLEPSSGRLELCEHRRRVEGTAAPLDPRGQFGFLFDNAEDTLTFSRFQTFNFDGWSDARKCWSRCCFTCCSGHQRRSRIPQISRPSKCSCLMRRGFFKNETIRGWIVQAQKTGGKQRRHDARHAIGRGT